MKRIIVAMLITMFFCTSAYAARIKKRSGFRVKTKSGMRVHSRDNFISTLTQASTTGLTSSSTDESKKSKKKALLNRFVADNLNNLSIDMAKGSGEYVEALAEIINITGENKEIFFQNLKTNFDIIFPSAETDHKYVVAEIEVIGGTY